MNTITSKDTLNSLVSRLDLLHRSGYSFQVLTGFDGFVDKIQKAVTKKEEGKNIYFNTIKEFSEHLYRLAGKSGQVEIVTTKVKMGGNAPIMANTLGNMGVKTYCVGSMGITGGVNPAFATMHPACEIISIADPGDSRAIEFNDGKIILSELSVFDNYNWEYIKSKIGLSKLQKIANESHLIAFLDWVNLPHASDIWDGFLHDVVKHSEKRDTFFLFDLCDPSKKSSVQIDEMLDLVSSFSPYGKVTLAVNENEAIKIWLTLNGFDTGSVKEGLPIPGIQEIGSYIYGTMTIDTLLIHPVDCTWVFTKQEPLEMKGRLVTNPKILTGGGDNLNAGYCLGLMAGLDVGQCMLLGMAASGAYIQNGRSANLDDLIQYIKNWASEIASASPVTQPFV